MTREQQEDQFIDAMQKFLTGYSKLDNIEVALITGYACGIAQRIFIYDIPNKAHDESVLHRENKITA